MINKSNKSTKRIKKEPIIGKSNKTKTIDNNRLKNEIIGIIYIVISILFYISRKYERGLIFGWLTRFLKVLFGKGYTFVPYLLILIGVLYFVNFIKERNYKKNIFIFLIFVSIISIITVLDKTIINSKIFEVRDFKVVIEYFIDSSLGIPVIGGGLVGGLFSYILVLLFGTTGSIIINISLIIILIISTTRKSFILTSNKVIKMIFSVLKKIFTACYEFVFILDKNKKNTKEKDILDINNKNKEYSYNDYLTKNEINKQKTINTELDIKNNKNNNFEKNNNRSIDDKVFDKYLNKSENQVKIQLERKNIKNLQKADINLDSTEVKFIHKDNNYKKPSTSLLNVSSKNNLNDEKREAMESADILLTTLNNFGIDCKLVQINRGPTITRYELQPAPGVKVSRITNLSKDIALSLAKSDLRIEAPIPGKAAIGIEVPNNFKSNVFLKEIIESAEYKNPKISIPFVVGKDIAGKNIVADITNMPHLLIAGATGSGKSVCINSLIISILYSAKPNEVKLILIDPKVVELNIYNNIPHLLVPVVTDSRKAANALNWAVKEMSNRYELFAKNSVRDIDSYNDKKRKENIEEMIPKIVVIIDELADLMIVAAAEVEDSITRLAQLARAAGIHLVIATQRPSVDVITGTIKANIPSRIAFAVSSYIDSRTILDGSGAEKLLGKGDLLYHPVGITKPIRIQGAFVSDDEVKRVIEFINNQNHENDKSNIDEEITNTKIDTKNDYDEYIQRAAELVVIEGQASVSYIQRKLKVGYSRAARIIDQLEEMGIVGSHEGSKPRRVLIDIEELEEMNF